MSEINSNCCGADILLADSDGHGKCAECFENCVPDEGESEYTAGAMDRF